MESQSRKKIIGSRVTPVNISNNTELIHTSSMGSGGGLVLGVQVSSEDENVVKLKHGHVKTEILNPSAKNRIENVHTERSSTIRRKPTQAQLAFKGKFMGADTPEVHMRKHVIEQWTHTFLVTKLLLAAVCSLIIVSLSIKTWGAIYSAKLQRSDVSNPISITVSIIFIVGGLLLLFSALFGAMGANRVVDDLRHDFDGLGTPGQDLLQIYFYIGLVYIVAMVPFSSALLLDPRSLLEREEVTEEGDTLKIVAILSFFASALVISSLYSTVMIVTPYKMSHSFLESVSVFIVGLALAGLYTCTTLIEPVAALRAVGSFSKFLNVLYCLILLCSIQFLNAIVGFFAGFEEDSSFLAVFAFLSFFSLACLFILLILFQTISFHDLVEPNCVEVLKTLSHVWWKDFAGCSKYGGSTISSRVEVFDEAKGNHFATSGVGVSVRCTQSENTVLAWEFFNESYSEPIFGCLQIACCSLLSTKLSSIKGPLSIAILLFLSLIMCSCVSAIWLRNNVTRKTNGKVKIMSWNQAVVMVGFISVFTVAGVYFTSTEFLREEQLVNENALSVVYNIAGDEDNVTDFSPASCRNAVLDGEETDVDCGGVCPSCITGHRCIENTDCTSGNCGRSSNRCLQPENDHCSNGVQDTGETDVDCGWDACGALCSDGLRCHTDKDCFSRLCSDGLCISCEDGMRNGDEGDIDCGSKQCLFKSYMVSSSSLKNIINGTAAFTAAEEGLCQDGRACQKDSHCKSSQCINSICSSCANFLLDGAETDIDCGGNCWKKCYLNQNCAIDSDCFSGVCLNSTCTVNFEGNEKTTSFLEGWCDYLQEENLTDSCYDKNLSLFETDVDCGGQICRQIEQLCLDSQNCLVNEDCVSNLCVFNGEQKVCASCDNGSVDGVETDTDCGGSCSKKCFFNQTCQVDADCDTGLFCFTAILQNYTQTAIEQSSHGSTISGTVVFPSGTCQLRRTINVRKSQQAQPLIFHYPFFHIVDLYNISVELVGSSTAINSSALDQIGFYCPLYATLHIDGVGFNFLAASSRNKIYSSPIGDSVFGALDDFKLEQFSDVQVVPADAFAENTCSRKRSSSFTVTLELSYPLWCSFLDVTTSDNSILFLPTYRTVQGLVRAADNCTVTTEGTICSGPTITGARIRVMSMVEHIPNMEYACNELAPASVNSSLCAEIDCSQSSTVESCMQLAKQGCCTLLLPSMADCTYWNLDEAPVHTVTSNGTFEVSIPEIEKYPEDNLSYLLYATTINIAASGFHSQNVILFLRSGEAYSLGSISLTRLEEGLIPCNCKNFANLTGHQVYCRFVTSYSCFRPPVTEDVFGKSCKEIHPDMRACDPSITLEPTVSPSSSPTDIPTRSPTRLPSASPSISPSDAPSSSPSENPTYSPSVAPSWSPSISPSQLPTNTPTNSPTDAPSSVPTQKPSPSPTIEPTASPTLFPTLSPEQGFDVSCFSLVGYLTDEDCLELGCITGLCEFGLNTGVNATDRAQCTGEWVTVFEQTNCVVKVDLGDTFTQQLFDETGLVRYDVDYKPYSYLRYFGNTNRFNTRVYDTLLYNWNEAEIRDSEYAIYSSEVDMVLDRDKWTYCGPTNDGLATGFPGFCGPETVVDDQWCFGYCAEGIRFGVEIFSFAICSKSKIVNTEAPTSAGPTAAPTGIEFSGKIVDMETGEGVLAQLYLYDSIVTSRSIPYIHAYEEQSVILSFGHPSGIISYQEGLCDNYLSKAQDTVVTSSGFSFSGLADGSYTLLAKYDKSLAPEEYQSSDSWIPLVGNPHIYDAEYVKGYLKEYVSLNSDSFRVDFSLRSNSFNFPVELANVFFIGYGSLETQALINVNIVFSSTLMVEIPGLTGTITCSETIAVEHGSTHSYSLYALDESTANELSTRLLIFQEGDLICEDIFGYSIATRPVRVAIYTSSPYQEIFDGHLLELQVFESFQVSRSFRDKIYYFQANGVDLKNVSVQVLRQVPEGQLKVYLEYFDTDDLDLVVDFEMLTTDNEYRRCHVGGKIFNDGVCQCGNAALTRDDVNMNKVKYDVLNLFQVHNTIYRFFISRSSVMPVANGNNSWRSDGRCGKSYPTAEGGLSVCPITPITWPDGATESRPCCSQSGYCSNQNSDCMCRDCIDFRRFVDINWTVAYRADGLCNQPNYLSDDGYPAMCPTVDVFWSDLDSSSLTELRPCCSEYGQCSIPSENNCNCQNCIDFRLLDGNGFYTATNVNTLQVTKPTEESVARLYLASPSSLSYAALPDKDDISSYYDEHNFVDGERTDSSTYTRMFCIDARRTKPVAYYYWSPRYFKYQREMLSIDQDRCPGAGILELITVSGFQIPVATNLGVLNGRYIRRFSRDKSYYFLPQVTVNSSCFVSISGYSSYDVAAEASVDECLSICDTEGLCEGILFDHVTHLCYFFSNFENCILGSEGWSQSVYRKADLLPQPKFWYTLISSLYLSLDNRLHLYRDDRDTSGSRWYFDNNLNPFDGYFSAGLQLQFFSDDVSDVSIWFTNSTTGIIKSEDHTITSFYKTTTTSSKYVPEAETHLSRVECSCDMNVFSRGMCIPGTQNTCAPFILRYEYTEKCLVPMDNRLIVDFCSPLSMGSQRWYFNSFKRHLETYSMTRTTPKIFGVNEQQHYVLGLNSTSLVEGSVDILVHSPNNTIFCSNQNSLCTCSGFVLFGIRYGSGDSNIFQDVVSTTYRMLPAASSINCDTSSFGGDPQPGKSKQCFCLQTILEPFEVDFRYSTLLLRSGSDTYCSIGESLPSTQVEYDFKTNLFAKAGFFLIFHAVDFGGGYRKYLHKFHGKGAFNTIKPGVHALLLSSPTCPEISADYLKNLTVEKVHLFFQLNVSEKDPLFFIVYSLKKVFNEIGETLERKEMKNISDYVRNILFAADTQNKFDLLVGSLVNDFPYTYDDSYEVQFENSNPNKVYLYKKAQLSVGELYFGLRDADEIFNFKDAQEATAFIDNVICAVVRKLGLVELSEDLNTKIENGVNLPSGSLEEVSFRAAALQAVETVVEHVNASGRELTSMELGNYFWGALGKEPEFRKFERHVTLDTIFY
eukprot:augustus_masked-scaffold_4-processed-gene-10.41-mRNA-1 protein AED:0.48 eAED:0.48 QI:0/0/0/0.33/1/1/3/0/3038